MKCAARALNLRMPPEKVLKQRTADDHSKKSMVKERMGVLKAFATLVSQRFIPRHTVHT